MTQEIWCFLRWRRTKPSTPSEKHSITHFHLKTSVWGNTHTHKQKLHGIEMINQYISEGFRHTDESHDHRPLYDPLLFLCTVWMWPLGGCGQWVRGQFVFSVYFRFMNSTFFTHTHTHSFQRVFIMTETSDELHWPSARAELTADLQLDLTVRALQYLYASVKVHLCFS